MPARRTIYFADVFSLFLLLFTGRPMSNEFSAATGRSIYQTFSVGRVLKGLDKFCIRLAIAQGTLPWQPIKSHKIAFFMDQSLLSRYRYKMDWNTGMSIGKLEAY